MFVAGPRLWFTAVILAAGFGPALARSGPLVAAAAFGDWRSDEPGLRRIIKPEDLPKPGATPSVVNPPSVVKRLQSMVPQAPAGFKVELLAEGLSGPREMRVAPNGDIFVAETGAGTIRLLRAADGDSPPSVNEIFVDGLNQPFGMAFFPSGDNPRWIYVANTDTVVRFSYALGDTKASGKPELIVAKLPNGGGHSIKNLVFTNDDKRMLISVGSRSNAASGIEGFIGVLQSWLGLGGETDRAAILAFDPNGRRLGLFATGIRNCVGLAIHPANGDLYCSTNERDGLGDDLVPDYITRVREGAFYGWPWFYIGDNEDPRHIGARAELAGKII